MSYSFIIPPPIDPAEFEELVRDCAEIKYGFAFKLYGRKGQEQHGADIWSSNEEIIIQCKNYEKNKNIVDSIREDFNNAKKHFKNMKVFVAAMSIKNDVKICDSFMEIGGKCIEPMFWDEFSKIISNNPKLLAKYYPDIDKENKEFEKIIDKWGKMASVDIWSEWASGVYYYPYKIRDDIYENLVDLSKYLDKIFKEQMPTKYKNKFPQIINALSSFNSELKSFINIYNKHKVNLYDSNTNDITIYRLEKFYHNSNYSVDERYKAEMEYKATEQRIESAVKKITEFGNEIIDAVRVELNSNYRVSKGYLILVDFDNIY